MQPAAYPPTSSNHSTRKVAAVNPSCTPQLKHELANLDAPHTGCVAVHLSSISTDLDIKTTSRSADSSSPLLDCPAHDVDGLATVDQGQILRLVTDRLAASESPQAQAGITSLPMGEPSDVDTIFQCLQPDGPAKIGIIVNTRPSNTSIAEPSFPRVLVKDARLKSDSNAELNHDPIAITGSGSLDPAREPLLYSRMSDGGEVHISNEERGEQDTIEPCIVPLSIGNYISTVPYKLPTGPVLDTQRLSLVSGELHISMGKSLPPPQDDNPVR